MGLRLARGIALGAAFAFAGVGACGAWAGTSGGRSIEWTDGTAVVGYRTATDLQRALDERPARIVRSIPALKVVELRPRQSIASYAAWIALRPGITSVERRRARAPQTEPAVTATRLGVTSFQWQYLATRVDQVPAAVLRAAAGVTVAVVDTGADLTAPDLAAKAATAYNVRTRSSTIDDSNGHGTFVASLAAGSVTNDEGIAGVGGDAQLMVVEAGGTDGSFNDVQEAAAIVWAVDHGARIVNLSFGGPDTSSTERKAIDYAVAHDVLLVAAVGNDHDTGNPIEYPAALLQPVASNGSGGVGLAVGASSPNGRRAFFSNTGSYLSLVAPGEGVFGAVASGSSASRFPRIALPGSRAGLYGYASGTSFAAPQVAGAAALVWAANPALTASGVADILEQTASGGGAWNEELGFGVLDVAAAVRRASPATASGVARPVTVSGSRAGRRVTLAWQSEGAVSYRVVLSPVAAAARVLAPSTTATTGSWTLPTGSYTFTVDALDATGAVASSAAWSVSLARAEATLHLAATRATGRAPLAVDISVQLRSSDATVATGGRTVVLESYDGQAWSRAAKATTGASGRAVWRFMLERGAYRVRARSVATADLAAAMSRTVALRAR